MRRAQMLGQIVVFVIGLIVVGGVILIGYNILQNLNEDRCDVARVQFATQLSTMIDRNRGWGTSRLVQLEAPCETVEVCFIDRRLKDQAASGETPTANWVGGMEPSSTQARDIIEDSVDPSVGGLDPTNVFTVQMGGIALPAERFSSASAPIQVSSPGSTEPMLACFPVEGGQVEIRMEGTGDVVRISDG